MAVTSEQSSALRSKRRYVLHVFAARRRHCHEQ